MSTQIPKKCPICGGEVELSTTTFAIDLDETLFVARKVPAWICVMCSERWFEDATVQRIEQLAEDARAKQTN